MNRPNVFRVVAERKIDNEGSFCEPVSQSYKNKHDAFLHYHYTVDIVKDGIELFVSEYSVDEDGMQTWVRDFTKEEMVDL